MRNIDVLLGALEGWIYPVTICWYNDRQTMCGIARQGISPGTSCAAATGRKLANSWFAPGQ